jgi:hypothetical protein
MPDPAPKRFKHADGRKAIAEDFQAAEFKKAGFKEVTAEEFAKPEAKKAEEK